MRLERVTDGDTLRLENGQRVRIVGINTLELRSQGWYQDHARQAKDQAAAFLPEWVQLTPWPAPTDRYGRLLANIWHQETYLAAELVTKGLAFAVAVPPNTRLARCLKQSEAAAQRQGVGIWSAEVYPQALADLDDDLGGFQMLAGAVTEIEPSRGKAVVILDGMLRLELASGIKPPPIGTRLVVRGWVGRSPKAKRARFTWTMKITHPANLDRQADS